MPVAKHTLEGTIKRPNERMYILDCIRGIGALLIIFWHWKHFFVQSIGNMVPENSYPYYSALSSLYKYGYTAVDLFFILSGFIFFKFYAQKIGSGDISFKKFIILRLSRLYPLFLVTLLSTLCLQYWHVEVAGHPFVYIDDNLQNFIFNLFLLHGIISPEIYAFNGPSWSISVEFYIYQLFFIIEKVRITPLIISIILIVTGIIMERYNSDLGRGIFGFFFGGLIFRVTNLIVKRRARLIIASFSTAILISFLISLYCFFITHARSYIHADFRFIGQKDFTLQHINDDTIIQYALIYFVYPLVITIAALAEGKIGAYFKPVSVIGEISYSVYLWHFPLQIAFSTLAWPHNEFFLTGSSMWMFLLSICSIGWLSYHFIERPSLDHIRSLLAP